MRLRLTVHSNAFISAYNRGFAGGGALSDAGIDGYPATGFGPGGGESDTNGSNRGGGHGGKGGCGIATLRGVAYDDAYRPSLAGSGGGARYCNRLSLSGGGGLIAVWTGEAYVPGQSLRSTRAKPVAFHDESEEAQFLGTVDVHGGASHMGTDAWKGGDGSALCFSNHRPGLKVIVR